MNTNILSESGTPGGVAPEPCGVLAALAALLVAAAAYLKRKVASQPELMSRAEFGTEMREMTDRIHADHLTLLEKLDVNHRELLAALERQGTRISALEAGFARLDERTGK